MCRVEVQTLRKDVVGMSEVVLPALFAFLIPAISIFLMYLHERFKENMMEIYADMEKICEIPETIDRIEPWFDSPKYPSSISSTDYPPGFSHRSHRTNCRNCAAPLPSNGKCIYCGTENDREAPEEQSSVRSEMKITPSGITFTCEPVRQSYQYESAATRDVYGRLHRKVINYNE